MLVEASCKELLKAFGNVDLVLQDANVVSISDVMDLTPPHPTPVQVRLLPTPVAASVWLGGHGRPQNLVREYSGTCGGHVCLPLVHIEPWTVTNGDCFLSDFFQNRLWLGCGRITTPVNCRWGRLISPTLTAVIGPLSASRWRGGRPNPPVEGLSPRPLQPYPRPPHKATFCLY